MRSNPERKTAVLLVEDNLSILEANKEVFASKDYDVLTAQSLSQAYALFITRPVDLIVLDVMLPDGSGIDFVRKIRGISIVPILMLTCLEDKKTLLSGFSTGCDDYLTKPYDFHELLARSEMLVKKRSATHSFTMGKMEVNWTTYSVIIGNNEVVLKPKEFVLFLHFLNNINRQLSASDIFEQVWGYMPNSDIRTVIVHISRLRNKLLFDKDSMLGLDTVDKQDYILRYNLSTDYFD